MTDTQIMPQPIVSSAKKRKRAAADGNDNSSKRNSLGRNNHSQINGTSQNFSADEFAQQLQNATHDINSSMSNTAAVALGTNPLSSDTNGLSFASNGTGPDQSQQLSSFDMSDPSSQPTQSSPYGMQPGYKPQDGPPPSSSGQDSAKGTPNKPVVGTEEWNKLRRDNHKEVERRRREAINEGINALATIVPNCEKNKGSILQRAVTYINELRAEVQNNAQKKVMEKAVLDHAVNELTSVNSNLQEQLRSAFEANDRLKKRLRDAGLDDGLEDGE